MLPTIIVAAKNFCPKRLVKIWPLAAETLLICTNIARTYMLPEQMLLLQFASVKDGPRRLPLKFSQNRVSNIWYIPDMDKCCQDKCWLDKYHHNGWHMLKKGSRNLPLKFGQHWVSNSRDIADVNKCHQGICCLNECHNDSCHLLNMVQGTYI